VIRGAKINFNLNLKMWRSELQLKKFRAGGSDSEDELVQAAIALSLESSGGGPSSPPDVSDNDLKLALAQSLSTYEAEKKQEADLRRAQKDEFNLQYFKQNEQKLKIDSLYNEKVKPLISSDEFRESVGGNLLRFSYKLEVPRSLQSLMNVHHFFTNVNFVQSVGGSVRFCQLYHGTCEFYANKILKEGFNFGHRHLFGNGIYFTNDIGIAKHYADQASANFKALHPEDPNLEHASCVYLTCIVAVIHHPLLSEQHHVIAPFVGNMSLRDDIVASKSGSSSCVLVSSAVEQVKTANLDELVETMRSDNNVIRRPFYIVVSDVNTILPLKMIYFD